jgi:hypothetical protein
MEWVGDKNDLVKYYGTEASEFWVIKFNGKAYAFDNKSVLHTSENRAKAALRKHVKCNFWHCRYWHGDYGKKDNTFYIEGNKIWENYNNYIDPAEKEFTKVAKSFTEYLLKEKFFTIEKITL